MSKGSNPTIMKGQAPWFILLATALAAVFWLSSQVSATEKKVSTTDNVIIKKMAIKDEVRKEIILPGTTVSSADAEAMNQILNQYDKTLFRIDIYQDGKRKKSMGALTSVITDRRLASDLAAAIKQPGFSQYAFRIDGLDDDPTFTPIPKAAYPSPVPGATTDPTNSKPRDRKKSKELFMRLEEILKKYQKK